jgi:electron transfer flavoprotein alpha/beta subunit
MQIVVLLRSVHRGPRSNETLPGLGPCDRAALHTALSLAAVDKVVALTAGPQGDEACLIAAHELGVTRAIRLWDAFIDSHDQHALAAVVAAGVQRLGPDLVLSGHRSADWGTGVTGPGVAHILNLPLVTGVVSARTVARPEGELLEVDQLREEALFNLEVELPAMLTVVAGPSLPPREPATAAVEVWDMQDLTLKMMRRSGKPETAVEPAEGRRARQLDSAPLLLTQLRNAGLLR